MAGDIFEQCKLFDSVKDRIQRLFMLDDETFIRISEEIWAKSMLAELDWLGFLVTERVLPAKLVERSFGREALGLIATLQPTLDACVKDDPQAFENLRQWQKQLVASSVKPMVMKASEVAHG